MMKTIVKFYTPNLFPGLNEDAPILPNTLMDPVFLTVARMAVGIRELFSDGYLELIQCCIVISILLNNEKSALDRSCEQVGHITSPYLEIRPPGNIWRNNLMEVLATFRDELYHQMGNCDVALCCNDGVFKAHKVVLRHYIPTLDECLHPQTVEGSEEVLPTICIGTLKENVFWFLDLLYDGLVGVEQEDQTRIDGIISLLIIFNVPVTSKLCQISTDDQQPYLLAGPLDQMTFPTEPYDSKTGEALRRFKEDMTPPRLRTYLMGATGNPMNANNSMIFAILEEMLLINGTRRPPNCFIVFSMTIKGDLAHYYDFENFQNLSRLVGKMWRHLDDEYKAPFVEAAAYVKEFRHNNFPQRLTRGGRVPRANVRGVI